MDRRRWLRVPDRKTGRKTTAEGLDDTGDDSRNPSRATYTTTLCTGRERCGKTILGAMIPIVFGTRWEILSENKSCRLNTDGVRLLFCCWTRKTGVWAYWNVNDCWCVCVLWGGGGHDGFRVRAHAPVETIREEWTKKRTAVVRSVGGGGDRFPTVGHRPCPLPLTAVRRRHTTVADPCRDDRARRDRPASRFREFTRSPRSPTGTTPRSHAYARDPAAVVLLSHSVRATRSRTASSSPRVVCACMVSFPVDRLKPTRWTYVADVRDRSRGGPLTNQIERS